MFVINGQEALFNLVLKHTGCHKYGDELSADFSNMVATILYGKDWQQNQEDKFYRYIGV